MTKRTIIALLTDFGACDGYAAAMKGVILSRARDAEIVDITHAIAPQQIRSAAYVLWNVYRHFPPGTIFVAVVDPGVGSSRTLCCTRAEGQFFLHPDNGTLDLVLASSRAPRSVRLTNPRYHLRPMSETFHGRDILAPAAAALANGTPMRSLGPSTAVHCPKSILRPVSGIRPARHTGTVLHIDHFGNIVTNFWIKGPLPSRMTARIRTRSVSDVRTHYAEAAARRPFLLAGSSSLLEIAVRDGNAARSLGARLNDPITLSIRQGTR